MGLFDFFIKDVETKDSHANKELRTHYYKAEYRDVKEAIIRYLKKNNLTVSNVDDTYGEILVEQSKFHMIISIKKFSVLETAVDVKVSFYGLMGMNRPHKLINAIYTDLDQQLRYIGVGLHP